MKTFTSNTPVELLKEGTTLPALFKQKINEVGREDKDDPFYICDLGDIVQKLKVWREKLPRVEPHYAVKCNDDPMVLKLLANMGTGFDCASKSEIMKILDLKLSPSRIVFANPCKQASYIKYAAKQNVSMMTFDNETELHKIKAIYPGAELIIRILPPDESKSQCQLGMKYGVHPKHALKLLKLAKQLDLNVIGVSFHVGSGCSEAACFPAAVASARTVFDMGKSAGFNFSLLDIGGGFPGQKSAAVSFEEIVDVLAPALDRYFPESSGVRIISEPGRYFVASAFSLAVNVIAKRCVPRDMSVEGREVTADEEPSYMYYVNDGVYGSFNCLMYDHATVTPSLLDDYEGEAYFTSSVWGPTCDGLDCILDSCQLPELHDGDWLYFADMGAYTMVAASNFNGMPKARCFYVVQDKNMHHLNVTSRKDHASKKEAASCCNNNDGLGIQIDYMRSQFQDACTVTPEK